MRGIVLSVLLIGLLMFGMAGCPKNQMIDVPPGVSQDKVQTWYTATGAVKVIAETTKGVTDSVIALKNSDPNVIPANDYQTILLTLGKTAQAGIHVDSILKKVPSDFGKSTKEQIMAEIQPVIAQLQQADLEGIFRKNQSPRMQAELAAVQTLTQSAQLLLTLTR